MQDLVEKHLRHAHAVAAEVVRKYQRLRGT
jgi:hypothetical protein